MDAIVVCGGQGSRVANITHNARAKIMIPILGRPFMEYLVDALQLRGVDRIFFAAGIHGNTVQAHLYNMRSRFPYKHSLIKPKVYIESDPLGTAGGVINIVKDQYYEDEPADSGWYDSHVAVINGDSFILPSDPIEAITFERVLRVSEIEDPDVVIYMSETEVGGATGTLELNYANDCILSFKEKDPRLAGTVQPVSLGWYIIRKDLLFNLPDGPASFEYDLFPRWIGSGKKVVSKPLDFRCWFDIGTEAAVADTERRIQTLALP